MTESKKTSISEKIISRLNRLSSWLFFIGFPIGKISLFPIAELGRLIIACISLSAYLLGYIAWLITATFSTKHTRLYHQWYGFLKVAEQDTLSSIIGILATLFCIVSLAIPWLAVLSSWLFVASNVFWVIAHYHRMHNVFEHGKDFSTSSAKSYLWYALFITIQSIISAISITLCIVFPPSFSFVFFISMGINAVLIVVAYQFWLDYQLGIHPTDKQMCSYNKISENLQEFPTSKKEPVFVIEHRKKNNEHTTEKTVNHIHIKEEISDHTYDKAITLST